MQSPFYRSAAASTTLKGEAQRLGNGSVRTDVELDSDGNPITLGIAFDAALLEGLPPIHNRTSRCWDLDGNGKINDKGECDKMLGCPLRGRFGPLQRDLT